MDFKSFDFETLGFTFGWKRVAISETRIGKTKQELMKKVFTPASILTVALISCGLLCSTGCKKDESAPPEQPKNETPKPAPGAASEASP